MAQMALTALNLQADDPPVAPKHPTVSASTPTSVWTTTTGCATSRIQPCSPTCKPRTPTAAVTKPLKPFEDTLYREMLGRIQETDLSVPYRLHGWLYYSRPTLREQYPILVPEIYLPS